MPPNPYAVQQIPGLKPSKRRGIVFLLSREDQRVDALRVFERLGPNRKREILTRFDHWIDGNAWDKYYHGWPNHPEYKHCFVFKWKENRQNHRFYGFLFNPCPVSNPAFQICVLVSHATKNEWETETGELDGANSLRLDRRVAAAINIAFPDSKEGDRKWLH